MLHHEARTQDMNQQMMDEMMIGSVIITGRRMLMERYSMESMEVL